MTINTKFDFEVIEDSTPVPPAKVETAPKEDGEPCKIHDAVLYGNETPAMAELLNRPASLLIGEMWGARDRRNTQDEGWNPIEMPWASWIVGGEGDKKNPAWGFSRHTVGKNKEGSCAVLGSSIGKARQAKAMRDMYAMGLDIDSGARLDDVIAKIEDLGLFCLIYTSFNHGKRGLQLKRDDVLRKLQIDTDPTLEQVIDHLRRFDKNRYEDDFLAGISIAEAKKQVKEGVVIVLDTPPLDKFRLVFPLQTPVTIIDLAETHEAALSAWEDKITGLAQNMFGIHFDVSCTDCSRLFFTGRHPKNAVFKAAIVQGNPLQFEDIVPMKKAHYLKSRMDQNQNPYEVAGGGTSFDRAPQAFTPSGVSLNEWHRECKDRFLIADFLDTYCSDRIRIAGGEASGHVHTECPFEGEHGSEGGTGTMAINCIDSQSEYWTWFCKHDACQGRHKLAFIEEALRQNWFDEALLFDNDTGFLLPPADDEDDVIEPESVVSFNKATSESTIYAYLKSLVKQDADAVKMANAKAELVDKTALGLRSINKLHNDAKKEAKKEQRPLGHKGELDLGQNGFAAQCAYGEAQLAAANDANPSLFYHIDGLAEIDGVRIGSVDRYRFRHVLNNATTFLRDDRDVGVPTDVADHLFSSKHKMVPRLHGLVTTPAFTRDGGLLAVAGYDAKSKLYYRPDASLVVPAVPPVPSDADVYEAKRLLIEECFADFPLGALTRTEIVAQALNGDGVPAVANLIALALLPFTREMVDGPTPGALCTKPTPATGASLLTDTVSIIATGRAASQMTMPTRKEELEKLLTSVLRTAQPIVVFDNVSVAVDSGALASALTSKTYQARILGKSDTVDVDVRCSWIFTGNNVTMSAELLRRLYMIDLDTRLARPEIGRTFRHADIRGWATKNRGRLVWACLTLVQNWVTRGMVPCNDVVIASFENWSGVMGGILRDAGIGKFLGNRDALKECAADAATEALDSFGELLVEYAEGTPFRPASEAPYKGRKAVSVTKLLNTADDGGPLQIPGWDCDKNNGYTSAQSMRKRLDAYSKAPHEVTVDGQKWRFTLNKEYCSNSKNNVYIINKTAI